MKTTDTKSNGPSLSKSSLSSRLRHHGTFLVLAAATSTCFSGCAVEPLTPVRSLLTVADTVQIYVYPTQAQSNAQLDRDRYECHQWAVQQTHFDPSASTVRVPVLVESRPAPGVNTAAGAIAGAVLGAAIGSPHDAAVGAVAGAIAGGAIGAAADSSQQRNVAQQQYARRDQRELAQAQDYRRAISACFEGRGYTVK